MEFKSTRGGLRSANRGQGVSPALSGGRQMLVDGAENLLKHIPGEASGFYLLAVDALDKPTVRTAGLIFLMALVLLIAVRVAVRASRSVMLTTLGAFLLWMLILDKGFLHLMLPQLLPDPLGLIVAVFYSTLVTVLANAGVIR